MQRGRKGGRQGKSSGETLGVRGDNGGRKASEMAHESPGVGDEEGGCEASGVAKNPQGSRQVVGGGVKLPQVNDTPGVTELPRGDETPGVTTAGARRPREDGRGWGGDKKPPTTRATGATGGGGGDEGPMSRLRTAETPRPQRVMVADEGSAETPSRHTSGTNSARPNHGALTRREYSLLAPVGTAVDPADKRDPGSAAGHGATGNQGRR